MEKNESAVPVVSSFNEWDPLEEVVVGVVEGAAVPEWHIKLEATMPEHAWDFFKEYGGQPFPEEMIEGAVKDLNALVAILKREGVVVKRPEQIDFAKPYKTLDWESVGGLYAAMPRDILMVIGDTIVEAPMAWRSRYFEVFAYRKLIIDYFKRGARWLPAPKPRMADDLYDYEYQHPQQGEVRHVITNVEPTFDAADFMRFGKDIFVQKSNVTNDLGIEWVRRQIDPEYTVHELTLDDDHAMHIDASIIPLAPGKLLINPERAHTLPPIFNSWEKLPAPSPCGPNSPMLCFSSPWLSMNVLSLDEKRVIVEAHETTLIDALKGWGFDPIPCPFRNFYSFGGSIHCATLDVRRRGTLQSYF